MSTPVFCLDPVAIGGLGGSGTRLVADILAKTGCFIGPDLNASKDNLWFSLLMRRYSWFREFPPDQDIRDAITLFHAAMTSGLGTRTLSPREMEIFQQSVQDVTFMKARMLDRLLQAANSLRNSQPVDARSYARWGWKEPNTHIYLPYLADIIPNLKYIHVVRDGLDMVYSGNQNQLVNWGRYILGTDFNKKASVSQKLDFWIAANLRALETGREKLGKNLFVLSYDDLCTTPEKALPAVLEFLESSDKPESYYDLISPNSLGRSKSEDTSFISDAQKQNMAYIRRQFSH